MTTAFWKLCWVLVLGVGLTACGSDTAVDAAETPSQSDTAAEMATEETPLAEALADVTDGYFELKDALVQTDYNLAKTAATAFQETVNEIDWAAGSATAAGNKITSAARVIAAAGDVEAQRTAFSELSNALAGALEKYGTAGETIYLQHCPMAFDNTGADWLSDSEEIMNPYFGDKMLHCGKVDRVLQ